MAKVSPSLDGWYASALAAGTPREVLKLGISAFYASREWKAVRFDVLAVCPRCCLCSADLHLHVDHIVPLKVDWGRRLDKGNLQVLCRDCNHGKASRDSRDFRLPNERADLMYPLRAANWEDDLDDEGQAESCATCRFREAHATLPDWNHCYGGAGREFKDKRVLGQVCLMFEHHCPDQRRRRSPF